MSRKVSSSAPSAVVAPGQLDRVAHVAKVGEVDALHDPAGVDVEARDDAYGNTHAPLLPSAVLTASSSTSTFSRGSIRRRHLDHRGGGVNTGEHPPVHLSDRVGLGDVDEVHPGPHHVGDAEAHLDQRVHRDRERSFGLRRRAGLGRCAAARCGRPRHPRPAVDRHRTVVAVPRLPLSTRRDRSASSRHATATASRASSSVKAPA